MRLQALGHRVSRASGVARPNLNRGRIDYITWACALIPEDVLSVVGDLDERFFMYWEDTDYGIRAAHLGFKSMVAEEAVAYHAPVRNEGNGRYAPLSEYLRMESASSEGSTEGSDASDPGSLSRRSPPNGFSCATARRFKHCTAGGVVARPHCRVRGPEATPARDRLGSSHL